MPNRVFISYASRYRDWVRCLARHLTAGLGKDTVFFDESDLDPGQSWVSALQAALERADRFVLVCTPETFASPWARQELETFQTHIPDWQGRGLIQLVLLVDTPLPPFLASAQQIDFRYHDGPTYRTRLASLIAALRGLGAAEAAQGVVPTDNLEAPEAPHPDLPDDIRQQLVQLLSPLFQRPYTRTTVAARLKIPDGRLEGHSSPSLAVSAALVCQGRRPASLHARDLLDIILSQELSQDIPGLTAELRAITKVLSKLAPATPERKQRSHPPMPVPMVHPTGTVPLDSALYICRESDDVAEGLMDRQQQVAACLLKADRDHAHGRSCRDASRTGS